MRNIAMFQYYNVSSSIFLEMTKNACVLSNQITHFVNITPSHHLIHNTQLASSQYSAPAQY